MFSFGQMSSLLPFPRNEPSSDEKTSFNLSNNSFFLNTHRRMTICGLEGCGKSALVLEFAYRTLARYSRRLVFWVPAISQDSFELAYREIGIRLLIPGITDDNADIRKLVKDTLSLIDLDLAKELDSMPSGARHRTGTMQFMAIEALEGKGHTYRHDLESFFYVFIWMCIRYGYGEIANTKRGHMDKNRFENVVVEFAPNFENLKPLARELRYVRFPITEGAIFTGTFHDHNIVYDGMINAFNGAIDRLGKDEHITA
ncbi:hypothetical protein B0O99DRAFT_700240 [Bisporella sp. PMI_857]|nr:hypothetical protein B0O99DRAFT_700240 [Bisporella sp. PMI_857]